MKKMYGLMALAVFAMLSVIVSAQAPHPHYLKALDDLRDARWLLIHRGANDPAQAKEEQKAVSEIEAAIKEIKDASIDDGKNPEYAPHSSNTFKSLKDRLKGAYDYLYEADKEILVTDPNPVAQNLRISSHAHIKAAQKDIDALWTIYKIPQ